ncbi:MAG: pyridoxamine 5'-phosphate oxidase [Verrucomicrobiota bacterium]|nr:pyridoxamine 5'-phosphate oxidase [Verrucomicrobiota bacterium]
MPLSRSSLSPIDLLEKSVYGAAMADTTIDIAGLRREYTQAALDETTLAPNPFDQFQLWFEQACKGGLLEPNAMIVSTVDAEGRPDSRTVLMKKLDAKGLLFFTNFESNKAEQIAANHNVSLLFPWYGLERQVIINGTAEKASMAEALAYFATRPLGSRLGAWASPQSKVITSRSLLEGKLDEMKRKFANGEVPLPSFWGGFRVTPRTFEFWQGRSSRLHDRFRYHRVASTDAWIPERLAP